MLNQPIKQRANHNKMVNQSIRPKKFFSPILLMPLSYLTVMHIVFTFWFRSLCALPIRLCIWLFTTRSTFVHFLFLFNLRFRKEIGIEDAVLLVFRQGNSILKIFFN